MLDEGDLRGGERRAKHLHAPGLDLPVAGRGEEVEKRVIKKKRKARGGKKSFTLSL